MGKGIKRKNKGLSLIEVIVAVALFAIVVTPLLTTMVQSVRINAKSRRLMTYSDVAQCVLEGYTDKTFADIKGSMEKLGDGGAGGEDLIVNGSLANNGFSTILTNTYNMKANSVKLAESTLGALSTADIDKIAFTGGDGVAYSCNTVDLVDGTSDGDAKVIGLNGMYATYVRNKMTSDGADVDTQKFYFTPGEKYAFAAYTGIRHSGYYCDVVLSIVPMAKDDDDKWYSYEIFVTLYPYESDTEVADRMTGDPLLTYKSGIRSRVSF